MVIRKRVLLFHCQKRCRLGPLQPHSPSLVLPHPTECPRPSPTPAMASYPTLLAVPGWRRPLPPAMPAPLAEWQWLAVGPDVGLQLDSTVALGPRCEEAGVRQLLDKALAAPLLPSQQQSVIARLDADPQLVHAMRLQPQQMTTLVEHTPMLAYQLLARMLGSSTRAADYHKALAHMPLSLHSMEVVNKLTASGRLPADAVHLYISNCIITCNDAPDKFLQNRLVRLVCVFLQSLIRDRVIDVTELLLEVQAFCVKFSRIREAATLFRALKQMEQGPCEQQH